MKKTSLIWGPACLVSDSGDKRLAKKCAQCSEAAIDGVEQANEFFYESVAEAYARFAPDVTAERTVKACKCRFSIISSLLWEK